jgi:hypothetical protein
MKRIRWLMFACLIVWIAWGVVIKIVVPTRTLPQSEWFTLDQRRSEMQLPVDATIERMIRHAKIDSLINPADGYRLIYFGRAWRTAPNDVWLMFGVTSTDIAVIYRGSLESGQLYWKAVESESP